MMKEVVMPFVERPQGRVHRLLGDHRARPRLRHADARARRCGPTRRSTTASPRRLDGDEYVLNGQKSAWVSNGTIATHALAFLGVDRKMGMAGGGVALVPLNLPGVTKGPPLNKIGQRALNQGEIFFDDVRIPKQYMLVAAGARTRWRSTRCSPARTPTWARRSPASRAPPSRRRSTYTKNRVQGGVPISEHQLVQKKLFDMFVEGRDVAAALARGGAVQPRHQFPPGTQYSITSKVYCTQAAFEVASDALQLHGGYGLTKEMLVEKLFRDARASMIEDGSNDILSLTAAQKILDQYVVVAGLTIRCCRRRGAGALRCPPWRSRTTSTTPITRFEPDADASLRVVRRRARAHGRTAAPSERRGRSLERDARAQPRRVLLDRRRARADGLRAGDRVARRAAARSTCSTSRARSSRTTCSRSSAAIHYQGHVAADDVALASVDVNRFWDTFGDEADYRRVEPMIFEFARDAAGPADDDARVHLPPGRLLQGHRLAARASSRRPHDNAHARVLPRDRRLRAGHGPGLLPRTKRASASCSTSCRTCWR